jgi:outer membrane lipoprotein-sorting protein
MARASRLVSFALLLALMPLTGCVISRRPRPEQPNTANLRVAAKDDLINSVDSEARKIKTLEATVYMTVSVGGAKKKDITEYHDVKGYILVSEPDMLRMIGYAPVVRTKIFDMVSDGARFKLLVPPKNKFYVGAGEVLHPSENPLQNLRPQVIFSALLLHPIEANEIAVLEVGLEDIVDPKSKRLSHQLDYELLVTRCRSLQERDSCYLARKIIFRRTDLLPHRQIIYDQLGNIATDAHYEEFKSYGDIQFPAKVSIDRPREELSIDLSIDALKVNSPLQHDQFVLSQPAGAQLIDVDVTPPSGLTAGGGTRNDNPPKPKPEP